MVYRCCRKNTFSKYYNYILKYNFSQLRLQLGSLTILAVKQLPRELLGYRKAAAASSVNYFISHGELQAEKAPLATSNCLLRQWHSCEALNEQSWKLLFYSNSSLWATAGSRPNAKTTEESGGVAKEMIPANHINHTEILNANTQFPIGVISVEKTDETPLTHLETSPHPWNWASWCFSRGDVQVYYLQGIPEASLNWERFFFFFIKMSK